MCEGRIIKIDPPYEYELSIDAIRSEQKRRAEERDREIDIIITRASELQAKVIANERVRE